MALLEGCRHSLEISIPVEEVSAEAERVLGSFKKKARLPGFRPGKVPAGLVRKHFESDIRQQVMENLIPRFFRQEAEREELKVVGTPDIVDVKFEPDQPLWFKAEFEVAPEFDLKDYRELTVQYHDPQITDADVDKRLEDLRQQKADFANVDPRPLEDGDFAVVALESVAGVPGPPIHQDELMIEIGGAETMPGFTENLRGVPPGEDREFDVSYPDDYAQQKLAGKTIRFQATVKGVRKKELPELNDEFARDLGDYQDMGELRESIRKALFAEREAEAQREAKDKLVEQLVDMHEFPVPEAYLNQQIRNRVEQNLNALAANGVDVSSIKLDWEKLRSSQRDKALREVKASLILGRISERESIDATRDEVDREVERFARQRREPVAALRIRFEKDGSLGRIASHIQTEKTLAFLFEHAHKEA